MVVQRCPCSRAKTRQSNCYYTGERPRHLVYLTPGQRRKLCALTGILNPDPGSLAPGGGKADLDFACRHLGVLLLADEVELGRSDIAMPSEFPHLVHRRPVADGVVDRRLAQ